MAYDGGIDFATKQQKLHEWVVSCTGLAPDHVVWGGQQAPRPAQPGIIMRLMMEEDNISPWLDTETNTLTFDDVAITSVDFAAGVFTKTGHGLLTGDGPVYISSDGTIPGDLAASTNYWVIRVDDDHFKLASGFVNAMNGVALSLSDAGTGNITISATSDTVRAGEEINYVQRSLLKATFTLECYTDTGVGQSTATSILWRIAAKRLLPTQFNILNDANISVIDVGRVRWLGGTQGQYLFEPRAMLDIRLYLASEDSETGTIIERTENTNETTLYTFSVDVES